MLRSDLRSEHSAREFNASIGGIADADGSAMVSTGLTTVRALINGPSQPRYSRHENNERCTLEVQVDFLTASSGAQDSSSLRQRLLRVLSQCVALESFPRMLITAKVVVSGDDGAVYESALNCCILALLDAALPMTTFACAVSGALLGDRLLVDATRAEEQLADTVFHATFNANNLDSPHNLLSFEASGLTDAQQLARAQTTLQAAAANIQRRMASILAKKQASSM